MSEDKETDKKNLFDFSVFTDPDKYEEFAADARRRNPFLQARHDNNQALLTMLKAHLPELEKLLKEISGHWTYEDGIYRYYHHSFKVFDRLQPLALEIVAALKTLAPNRELNPMFMRIVSEGTGKEWIVEFNEPERWQQECRPIVEAFLHAKYFLEMAVKYGKELESPPKVMPSGWAAFLYLYNLR